MKPASLCCGSGWLAGDVLICVSMLGMYLPAELILG